MHIDNSALIVNKSKLIHDVSEQCVHVAVSDVDKAVRLLLDLIIETLADNGRVEVRDFGSFCLRHYNLHQAHNPKTGAGLQKKTLAIPYFKAGKALRVAVNGEK